jgi:hypothetical protein
MEQRYSGVIAMPILRILQNQGQNGLSRLRCVSTDFFGLPILRGPADRPSSASIAARNRFDP